MPRYSLQASTLFDDPFVNRAWYSPLVPSVVDWGDPPPTPLCRRIAAVLSALSTRAELGFTPFIEVSPRTGEFVKVIV